MKEKKTKRNGGISRSIPIPKVKKRGDQQLKQTPNKYGKERVINAQ